MRTLILLILASYSTLSFSSSDISNYMDYKKGGNDSQLIEIQKKQDVRLRTMKDAAIHLGIQVGFNEELDNIKSSIAEIEPELSGIFDFGTIMRTANTGKFSMYMLPGVVEEYNGSVVVSEDGREVTTTEKTIRLLENEKMVSEAPDWRNYLYQDQKVAVQEPFDAVLPESDSEQQLWQKWLLEGYEIGLSQANAEVIAKARKLRLNFTGRVKYIRYALTKKFTVPEMSYFKTDLITNDNEMSINQRKYTLNQGAKFNPDTGEWEILFLDNREGFRNDTEK